MGRSLSKLGLLASVLALISVAGSFAKNEEAYVTLLYGDEFVLGVRVLGKSIRDTGSSKDMVVLVSDGVSDYAKRLLQPNLTAEVRKSRPVPEMERLSTLYNADVGLYMLANKWMVDERELKVIHYTLGLLNHGTGGQHGL
ncbi:hypothetical protein HPP92_001466 [Vanilla planifolia]|uniref:Uncharacterized protein n=1 Tax=Vanilla planifolia TaxID=51239 RepID=A0A835RZV1_VANPL|nr:hypothetical protein HPP92_001466 [Vanilla planifolia]